MRVIGKISANEMIATFLRHEYSSPRFKSRLRKSLKDLKVTSSIITKANTKNRKDNTKRKKILTRCRGYPNTKLFERFPRQVAYYEVFITYHGLGKLRFINHEHWQSNVDSLREVRNCARAFAANKKHHGAKHIKNVRLALKKGKDVGPLFIVARSLQARKFVIVEGNVRGAALFLEKKQGPFKCIVAVSPNMHNMTYY